MWEAASTMGSLEPAIPATSLLDLMEGTDHDVLNGTSTLVLL